MPVLERFGVSMEDSLLARFDEVIAARGYDSRSEAIRDLIRQELVREEWTDPHAEVVGTITLVYEHHEHALATVLPDLQHRYHDCVVCSTHIHMDAHNCLEVIVVRGVSSKVKRIANTLLSTRGVKHGQLVSTTTGKRLG